MVWHTWLKAVKQSVVGTKAGIIRRMGRLGPEKKIVHLGGGGFRRETIAL